MSEICRHATIIGSRRVVCSLFNAVGNTGVCSVCVDNTAKGVWPILVKTKSCNRAVNAPTVAMSCKHRSSSYSLRGCSTCGGNVQIKIFQCSVHGRCSIRRHTSMIRDCQSCPDKKEPENGK